MRGFKISDAEPLAEVAERWADPVVLLAAAERVANKQRPTE